MHKQPDPSYPNRTTEKDAVDDESPSDSSLPSSANQNIAEDLPFGPPTTDLAISLSVGSTDDYDDEVQEQVFEASAELMTSGEHVEAQDGVSAAKEMESTTLDVAQNLKQFHCFPDLPPEIRCMIWYVLPLRRRLLHSKLYNPHCDSSRILIFFFIR